MAVAAGKLRHQVTIEAPNPTPDATGQDVDDWDAIGTNPTPWASIETVSSNEIFTSQEVQATATHKITMRYRGDLSAEYRITFNDPGTQTLRVFNLLGTPMDREGKRETIECLVAERSA